MRIPGLIPLTIRFPFWIVAFLIGFLNTSDFMGALMWVCIIMLSVLVHEYGHALTARFFGQKSRIELIAFGGVTIRHASQKLPSWKEFLIVLNGPLFGMLLALGAYLLMLSGVEPELYKLFQTLFLVNVFWTLINLVPVMPLDGGQLLTIVLEGVFGAKGVKASYLIGGLIGIVGCLISFVYGHYFLGTFIFIFSLESFKALWATRHLRSVDRDTESQKLFREAEELFLRGDTELAEKKLYAIRERTKEGIIYNECTVLLAHIKKLQGQVIPAFELMQPIIKELSSKGKVLLHELAIEVEDFKLAVSLSNECFQLLPGARTAFLNARASAGAKNKEAAIGWLESALREGMEGSEEGLSEYPEFEFLSRDPAFQKIVSQLEKGKGE